MESCKKIPAVATLSHSTHRKRHKQSTDQGSKRICGLFLAAQWLRLCASMGLIPGRGIKIPHSSKHSPPQKKSVLGSVSQWWYTVRIGKPCRKHACVHSPACPLSASPRADCQLPHFPGTQHSKEEPSRGRCSGEGRLTNTVLSIVAALRGRESPRDAGELCGEEADGRSCVGGAILGASKE